MAVTQEWLSLEPVPDNGAHCGIRPMSITGLIPLSEDHEQAAGQRNDTDDHWHDHPKARWSAD